MSADPITTEVIRSAYNAIAEDMSAVLERSAFTPSVYEMHDYGIALFNEKVELLGQYAGLPLFTGGLDAGVRATIARYGMENLRNGDTFTVNDPYITGGHLPDVDVICVIANETDGVIGFACIRAHWADIGQAVQGYSVYSSSIFEEGLRWGPTQIYRDGIWVRDIIDLFRSNSRVPDTIIGDLMAQKMALDIGKQRLLELVERFDITTVRSATEQIFAATERKFRAFVRSIPDGVYEADGYTDHDGIGDTPVYGHVSVTVKGDELTIDASKSSPQRPGNINCGLTYAVSASRLAFALLYPDANPELNNGSFKPLKVVVRPGTIYSAQLPAACSKPVPIMLLLDLVIKALAPVLPKNAAAGLPGDSWNIFFAGTRRDIGEPFFAGEALNGGWGAADADDGEHAVCHSAAGDFRNIPIETFEARYPILVTSSRLKPDSGGAGRHRGGLALVKSYQLTEPCNVGSFFDRSKDPSWGLFGGKSGSVPLVTLYPADEREPMVGHRFQQVPMPKGSRIVTETGGGGGFGRPFERDPAAVQADVRNGYVTPATAEAVYGVAFLPGGEEIDLARTARLRSV